MKNKSVFMGLSLIGLGFSLFISPSNNSVDRSKTTPDSSTVDEYSSNRAKLYFGNDDIKESNKPTIEVEKRKTGKKKEADVKDKQQFVMQNQTELESDSVEDTEVGKLFAAISGSILFSEDEEDLI